MTHLKLTPKQKAQLHLWHDKWHHITTNTSPTDKTEATQAIHLAYRLAGHPPPRQIIWQPHPVAAITWLVNQYPPYHATPQRPTPKRPKLRPNDLRHGPLLNLLIGGLFVIKTIQHDLEQAAQLPLDTNHLRHKNRPHFLTKSIHTQQLTTAKQAITTQIPNDLLLHMQQILTLNLHIFPNPPHNTNSLLYRHFNRSAANAFNNNRNLDVSHTMKAAIYGHLAPQQLPLFDFCHHILNLPSARPAAGLIQTAHHLGWWWPTPHYCLATPRPTTLTLDDQGRLHNPHGPALAYHDYAVYAWQGIEIPSWYVTQPDKITTNTIDQTNNTEIRRMLLERYGPARYLKNTHAQLIHQDQYGQLYRQPRRGAPAQHLLLVTNSTPEPDGTHKQYLLRVPPTIHTAHGAVAWTAGLSPHQYKLHAES
ncbi:MAG TPA: hypothetical protein VLL52_15480 [Anaerolineae bacterium]|nr:hypothetical protein [Anaerolineae bacterium]